MVARHSGCDPNRVRALLQGQVSSTRWQAEMEEHLETCEHCRQELENLAASAEWWTDVQRSLGGAGRKAVRHRPRRLATKNRRGESDEEENADWFAGFPNFLGPSDDPAMLGRLGAYEIVEVIGRGGMGVVLKGLDAELDR